MTVTDHKTHFIQNHLDSCFHNRHLWFGQNKSWIHRFKCENIRALYPGDAWAPLLLLSPYFWSDHRQVANFHFTLIFKILDFSGKQLWSESLRSTKVWRCSSCMFATQNDLEDWQYCSNHFKFGMFAQAEYHVCGHKEAQHVASLSTVCAGWSAGFFIYSFYKTDACSWTTLPCYWLRFKRVSQMHVFTNHNSQASPHGNEWLLVFLRSLTAFESQPPKIKPAKPKQFFWVFIYVTLEFRQLLHCCISSLLSFVLCFSGNLLHSHTPCGRAREKNAPSRDNKGYLKCDTVFQRMGGGGKKRRERGIVERR